jgi:hypothetical protein
MPTNAELDAWLFEQLSDEPVEFYRLVTRANSTWKEPGIAGTPDLYRPVDGALQRLRRAKRIKPAPKKAGWVRA